MDAIRSLVLDNPKESRFFLPIQQIISSKTITLPFEDQSKVEQVLLILRTKSLLRSMTFKSRIGYFR